MLEKKLFDQLVGTIKHGAVTVTYWDGDKRTYGVGKPYFAATIHHPRAVRQILKNRTLGFGESYTRGDIEISGNLNQLVRLISENSDDLAKDFVPKFAHRLKRNTKNTQESYIQHHYDVGNEFYKLWLDKSLAYSCAYFKKYGDTLEKAQKQKVDHVLRKLQLHKDHRLLDIGCGWGTLLFQAAEKYGVSGVGITLSTEQYKHCKEEARRKKLSHKLKFKLMNYQDLAAQNQQFDRVVSVGMYEHVGKNNQAKYFKAIDALLKPTGISVLHTISQPFDMPSDPWIDRYIFPGGHLPTIESIVKELPRNNLRLIDYESLKIHYALTLEEWLKRYQSNKQKIVGLYDEDFYRTWEIWLANSGAGFRYDNLDLSQFIFVKNSLSAADLPLTRDYLYTI